MEALTISQANLNTIENNMQSVATELRGVIEHINEVNNRINNVENKVSGVFGGVQFGGEEQQGVQQAGTIRNGNLPVKQGFWSKFKAFWLQEIDWNREIKVELTPYQQKVEDEINEFLHQDVSFSGFWNIVTGK